MTLNKEDLEFLDRIGVDDKRMKIIIKNKESAEIYQNLVFLFEQYDGGLHKYIDDLFCGRLPESKAYERLKKLIEELEEDHTSDCADCNDYIIDMLKGVLR